MALLADPSRIPEIAATAMPGHARALATMSLAHAIGHHAAELAHAASSAMVVALTEKRDLTEADLARLGTIAEDLFEITGRLYDLPPGRLSIEHVKAALGIGEDPKASAA